MEQIAIFQMLADTTRLRALVLLAREGELCVCELVQALELSQPKISRHLAALREAGLIRSRRFAQWIFYSLQPDLPAWQQQVVQGAINGSADNPQIRQDQTRLAQMPGRPDREAAA
jgi:ArsR family transcriptional regulator